MTKVTIPTQGSKISMNEDRLSVPDNPINFSNPRIDMIKVAFAGPASNIMLAILGGLIIRSLNYINLLYLLD